MSEKVRLSGKHQHHHLLFPEMIGCAAAHMALHHVHHLHSPSSVENTTVPPNRATQQQHGGYKTKTATQPAVACYRRH